jgi:hypothetical protein
LTIHTEEENSAQDEVSDVSRPDGVSRQVRVRRLVLRRNTRTSSSSHDAEWGRTRTPRNKTEVEIIKEKAPERVFFLWYF